jgi:hypothetical protein
MRASRYEVLLRVGLSANAMDEEAAMNLKVTRKIFTDKSTIGEMAVDGEFECFTLEDVVRPVKIKGKTAIPKGTYEVAITFSNKFKKLLPLLMNVPNFEGVRIHSGNTPEDTEGCILVGQQKSQDVISQSRLAFNALFAKMKSAIKKEKIFIEIVEEQ